MESGTESAEASTDTTPMRSQASAVMMVLRFGPPLLLVAVLAAALTWHVASGMRPSTAQATAPSTAQATATSAPAATATPNTTPLDMRAAWGNVAVRTLPTALPDNRALIFEQAATPDGQWLVCADVPREQNNTTRYSYLVLYNAATRQIRTVRRLATPQSQVLFASVDQHWLVWTEGTDAMGGGVWGMYSYNLQTGRVVRLADRLPTESLPYTAAVVDQGHAIWTEAVGPVTPDDRNSPPQASGLQPQS